MTDAEALNEIDRQEKRFAAAGFQRGLGLVKSAREYYDTILECRRKTAEVMTKCEAAQKKVDAIAAESKKMEDEARRLLAEVARRRSEIVKLRKVIRSGELLRNKEHKSHLMFEKKVARLSTMPIG